jgi:antirestriction protein
MKSKDTPRVYVADLHEYNCGNLVGRWFDLADYSLGEELQEAITEMLKERGHEEWAFHDYECMPDSLGEYAPCDKLVEVAQYITEHGFDLVKAFCSTFSEDELSYFSEYYRGTYASALHYAEEFVSEMYSEMLKCMEQHGM